MDPGHYDRIDGVATPADSQLSWCLIWELFEATPHHGAQAARIGVYSIQ